MDPGRPGMGTACTCVCLVPSSDATKLWDAAAYTQNQISRMLEMRCAR